jgi:hypothetical protein
MSFPMQTSYEVLNAFIWSAYLNASRVHLLGKVGDLDPGRLFLSQPDDHLREMKLEEYVGVLSESMPSTMRQAARAGAEGSASTFGGRMARTPQIAGLSSSEYVEANRNRGIDIRDGRQPHLTWGAVHSGLRRDQRKQRYYKTYFLYPRELGVA